MYSSSIDEGEVGNLLNEMRDAAGLEMGEDMVKAGKGNVQNNSAQQNNEVDEMQKKLDQLKHL